MYVCKNNSFFIMTHKCSQGEETCYSLVSPFLYIVIIIYKNTGKKKKSYLLD